MDKLAVFTAIAKSIFFTGGLQAQLLFGNEPPDQLWIGQVVPALE